MTFLLWVQQMGAVVAPDGTPSVGTIVTGFAGISALWLINLTLKNGKKLDAHSHALFGNAESRDPSGLVHDVGQMRTSVSDLRGELDGIEGRRKGDYEHLLNVFSETRDAMMTVIEQRRKPR